MVQLSHPYMTTRKIMTLTIWTFADKVMSLLFNTLSRFVIAFLPREQASFTLMAENEEELKSLLIKMREESKKADLKLNIQNMKIMASGTITSWQ